MECKKGDSFSVKPYLALNFLEVQVPPCVELYSLGTGTQTLTDMTEKWTKDTETTRLLQNPTQKQIQFSTFRLLRSNKQVKKQEILRADSDSSSQKSFSRSPSPAAKKSRRKTNSKPKQKRLFNIRWHSGKKKKKPKSCCPKELEQCSSSSSTPSLDDNLNETENKACNKDQRAVECDSSTCCVSHSSTSQFSSSPQKVNKNKIKCCCDEELKQVESNEEDLEEADLLDTYSTTSSHCCISSSSNSSCLECSPLPTKGRKKDTCDPIEKYKSKERRPVGDLKSDRAVIKVTKPGLKLTKNVEKEDLHQQLTNKYEDKKKETAKDSSDRRSYDPHLHRVIKKPTNNFETLVHLVKCSLGTGILAMPQAFAYSGFITGIIFTIIIGIMITHCIRMLIRAQYFLCKKRRVPLLTYSESMVAALELGPTSLRRFSKYSGYMVNVYLVILQLGVCCVYIVFIAGNLKRIVDPYKVFPIEYHMLIILGPLMAINCIPDLKILAPFSALGNILIIISLGIVVYYLWTGPHSKCLECIDLWGSIYTFPLFFGSTLFALTAVAVVTTLENNMQTPKDFVKPLGVLNVGMTMIVLLYVLIGTVGYLFCKSKCCDSILLNLPGKKPLVIAVLVMYAIAILISYVLQCYVPVDILWRMFFERRIRNAPRAKQRFWEYTLRISLCLLTFFFAVEIRRLGLFVSLLGIATLGIMIPALLEFCTTFCLKFSVPKYMTIMKDIVLFCIGLAALLVFSIAAMLEVIDI